MSNFVKVMYNYLKFRLFGSRPKPKRSEPYVKGIERTVVSEDYLKDFPRWEEDKFKNIKIVK